MLNERIERYIKQNMIQAYCDIIDASYARMGDERLFKEHIPRSLGKVIVDNIINKKNVFETETIPERSIKRFKLRVFCFTADEIIELVNMVKKDTMEEEQNLNRIQEGLLKNLT